MILTFSEEVDFFGRDDGDQAHGEHNEFHHDDDWGGIFVPSLERERELVEAMRLGGRVAGK